MTCTGHDVVARQLVKHRANDSHLRQATHADPCVPRVPAAPVDGSENGFERFLESAAIPLDNNASEQAVKNPVMGMLFLNTLLASRPVS